MEARVYRISPVLYLLIGVLLIQDSDQQGVAKKKPPLTKDVIEGLQKQMDNIVAEVTLLKEKQALQSVCLRGKKIQGKCFLADVVKKNYHAASEDCIAQGGTLAAPLTRAENQHLADYARESAVPEGKVWLGVNDMQTEGVWVDQTGAAVRFKNWDVTGRSSQPDGGTSKNCAVLSSTAGGKWSDEICRTERASICEFKIV